MTFVAIALIAVALVASPVGAQEHMTPREALVAALLRAGGEGGLLNYRGSLKASFHVESYNENDGFIREEVVEALEFESGTRRFRIDHTIERPERGPRKYHVRYYMENQTLWRVSQGDEPGTFEGEMVPVNYEHMRTFPYTLRLLAYFLEHPEQVSVHCEERGQMRTDEGTYRAIALTATNGSSVMRYKVFVGVASNLPARVEYVASDTSRAVLVTEYKNWKKMGALVLPEIVREADHLVENGQPGAEGSYYSTTRLKSIDFSPTFSDNYFRLPDNMIVVEKKQ